jgi:VIT1/CCC1 family predicted Fe2+/Mn2+ transporter
MSHIQTLQIALFISFIFSALLLVLLHWFPSMRGTAWTGQELTVAVILALLAIAVRPC